MSRQHFRRSCCNCTGYYSERLSLLVMLNKKLTGDALTKTKETDFKTALAGKVAGVQVISGTSSTYEPSAIRLRGETDVLYVVDGIQS